MLEGNLQGPQGHPIPIPRPPSTGCLRIGRLQAGIPGLRASRSACNVPAARRQGSGTAPVTPRLPQATGNVRLRALTPTPRHAELVSASIVRLGAKPRNGPPACAGAGSETRSGRRRERKRRAISLRQRRPAETSLLRGIIIPHDISAIFLTFLGVRRIWPSVSAAPQLLAWAARLFSGRLRSPHYQRSCP
jgi:hypothetical protein